MNKANALLFIHAQTSLHPGTGTALGTVDLPIQRERHTVRRSRVFSAIPAARKRKAITRRTSVRTEKCAAHSAE